MAHGRTAALGGHVYPGLAGGEPADREHAGTNRPGPTCPHAEATPWREAPRERLLPVPSGLVTLTLPEVLRPVARSHPYRMDTLRFQTSAAALNALAMAPQVRGGPLGRRGVLHPWTRDLADHPQVPSLVPGGAVSPQGSPWLSPRAHAWRVPVRARSQRFRGTCTAALTQAGLLAPVPPHVWLKAWGTPGEPVGTGTAVITDRAPDLRRMAITHNRLAQRADGPVTCRFKARGSHAWTHRTLPAAACIRRCLPHGRPKGLLTVRDDGVLRLPCRPSLDPIRTLLEARPCDHQGGASGPDQARQAPHPIPETPRHGRTCGGPLVLRRRLSPNNRGPPS